MQVIYLIFIRPYSIVKTYYVFLPKAGWWAHYVQWFYQISLGTWIMTLDLLKMCEINVVFSDNLYEHYRLSTDSYIPI